MVLGHHAGDGYSLRCGDDLLTQDRGLRALHNPMHDIQEVWYSNQVMHRVRMLIPIGVQQYTFMVCANPDSEKNSGTIQAPYNLSIQGPTRIFNLRRTLTVHEDLPNLGSGSFGGTGESSIEFCGILFGWSRLAIEIR